MVSYALRAASAVAQKQNIIYKSGRLPSELRLELDKSILLHSQLTRYVILIVSRSLSSWPTYFISFCSLVSKLKWIFFCCPTYVQLPCPQSIIYMKLLIDNYTTTSPKLNISSSIVLVLVYLSEVTLSNSCTTTIMLTRAISLSYNYSLHCSSSKVN